MHRPPPPTPDPMTAEEALRAALRALPAPPCSPGFAEAVLARLARESAAPGGRAWWRALLRGDQLRPVVGAALCGVVLTLAGRVFLGGPVPLSTAPPAPLTARVQPSDIEAEFMAALDREPFSWGVLSRPGNVPAPTLPLRAAPPDRRRSRGTLFRTGNA